MVFDGVKNSFSWNAIACEKDFLEVTRDDARLCLNIGSWLRWPRTYWREDGVGAKGTRGSSVAVALS